MKPALVRSLTGLLLVAALASIGCSEVSGRRRVQKANQLFRDGQYKEAVAMFQEAEALVPDFWLLWLNKGYTCRQMLVPGAKTPENEAAAKCALDAFKRLQALKPADPRGPALYVQTLFESDQYELLTQMYEARLKEHSDDEEALNGLVQAYSRWPDHFDQAVIWYQKKADARRSDPEAQYAVGVFIWQKLFEKGGGADKAEINPQNNPQNVAGSPEKKPKKRRKGKEPAAAPPPPQLPTPPGEIARERRIELANIGIDYLERAVQLRPKYHEAMTYLNLLYRQKSYAYFKEPAEWQKCVDKATEWRDKTLVTMGQTIPKPEAAAPQKAN